MLPEKNDKNIVRNAMIVLFLSLLIVYVIRYQTGGNNTQTTRSDTTSITDSLVINPVDRNATGIVMTDPTNEQEPIQEDRDTTQEEIIQPIQITGTDQDIADTEIEQETTTDNTNMKILSGTTLYFGPIDGIDKLGISYSYALRDDRNIYFVRLEDEPDLSAIARSLGGTLYTMNTETEIVRNELFGRRITFINLPEYRERLVLMYVEVGQETRLLQIPFNIYHQSKRYLQDLFID